MLCTTHVRCHPLRALAALGFTDCGAPSLPERSCRPGTSLPTSSSPSPSSAPSNVRQASSHTSCSSQYFNRRQQVAGDGYLSGKNLHAAAVSNTHSIAPSRPDWKPTDGDACPCDASAQAAEARSIPSVHHAATRIASCSCKRLIKPSASRRSLQLEAEPTKSLVGKIAIGTSVLTHC
jgi:hypothetical protein